MARRCDAADRRAWNNRFVAAPIGVESADQGRQVVRKTWPFVGAGIALLLLVLAVRDLSWGRPLSQPLGVLSIGMAVMTELALIIKMARSKGNKHADRALALVVGCSIVVTVLLGSSGLPLRWHVERGDPKLQQFASNIIGSDHSALIAEAHEKDGYALRLLPAPGGAGGFSFSDAAVASDGTKVWLDLTTGTSAHGVMSTTCLGLTYSPDGDPEAPNGFSKLGTSEFHPIKLGTYEHLTGPWYRHEWVCRSI